MPKSKNLYGSCCEVQNYIVPENNQDCYSCAGVGDIVVPS
jgi:hypothetical protein